MARPHIMFIQAQGLPWQPGLYAPGRDDVTMKLLSLEDDRTAGTCLVRYPAGWERDRHWVSAHEEFLVLDGAIEIDGRSYGRQGYGFLPAGYPRASARCPGGAVLLTMFHDRPVTWPGEPPAGLHDPRLLVARADPLAMAWDPGLVDPQLAKGVAIKPLRQDPDTGEVSFLYCSPPHRVPPGMAKPQWTHPMVEEIYCLAGDYVWGDCGRMGPGGYVWWRENVWHGPAGTDTGYLLFVRTIGGPLVNIFASEPRPFSWDPPYRPSLPPELLPFASPYVPPANY